MSFKKSLTLQLIIKIIGDICEQFFGIRQIGQYWPILRPTMNDD